MFKDWTGCGVYGRFRLGGKAAVAAGLLQVPLSLQPPHCVAAAGSAALRIPNAGGAPAFASLALVPRAVRHSAR